MRHVIERFKGRTLNNYTGGTIQSARKCEFWLNELFVVNVKLYDILEKWYHWIEHVIIMSFVCCVNGFMWINCGLQ